MQALKLVSVSSALMLGLASIAKLCKQSGKRSHAVAERATQLGVSLMTAGATRPAAEILSFACVIGGDAAAAGTIHECCEQLTRQILEVGSGVTGWALVLGAVYRSVGGIALQSLLPQSVGTLISLASKATAERALLSSISFWQLLYPFFGAFDCFCFWRGLGGRRGRCVLTCPLRQNRTPSICSLCIPCRHR